MNKILFDFYCNGGQNIHGLTLKDISLMSYGQLERSHNIIQWMFPLDEPSFHNNNAPILDTETIDVFVENISFINNFYIMLSKFWLFLQDNGAEKPHWVTSNNHNFLRISRVIKCCELLDEHNWAVVFYDYACNLREKYPEIIDQGTVDYWDEAFYG